MQAIVCRHDGGNPDISGSCLPNELELHISLVSAGFVLFNLLMNAGPNSTTFTLAPIIVPDTIARNSRWFRRRRCKTRRNVGNFPSAILKEKFGVPNVLGIISVVSLLGLVVTLILRREDTE